MEIVYGVILGLVTGGAGMYVIRQMAFKKKSIDIIRDAEGIAERKKDEKILEAKEKFLSLKEEHENRVSERNNQMIQAENRIKQKELALNQRRDEIQKKQRELEISKKEADIIKSNLSSQLTIVDKRSAELEKMHKEQVEKLEAIAGLSANDAKK
jgi:ribonucrease Y